MTSDTIYALSSAPGKGGVAVIRVSGPKALKSLELLTQKALPPVRKGVTRTLSNPVSRETIDHALVITFAAPQSFTGEDVVEYHVHGGLAVTDSLLLALSGIEGFRLAAPGEFTRRAFENGRLDLTEAEAIADLIDAETRYQKDQALQQAGGMLSRLYEGWREDLVKTLAYVEAVIDFPDEDVPDDEIQKALPKIQMLIDKITRHLDDKRRGERLRNGLKIVIIGAPNAGKSSLLNILARRDAAIVSDIAGTTRDVIDIHLDLGGYPVILSDTAGLRPEDLGRSDQEKIEGEGIKRALQKAREADLKLLLFDGSKLPELHKETLDLIDENALVLVNKVDLTKEKNAMINSRKPLYLSAKTEAGISEFLEILTQKVSEMIGKADQPSLTRARHRERLEDTKKALQNALELKLPELTAEDLRQAAFSLGQITGRVDVEDLLDVIFKDFCIGK